MRIWLRLSKNIRQYQSRWFASKRLNRYISISGIITHSIRDSGTLDQKSQSLLLKVERGISRYFTIDQMSVQYEERYLCKIYRRLNGVTDGVSKSELTTFRDILEVSGLRDVLAYTCYFLG